MIAIAPDTQQMLDRLLKLPPEERLAVAQVLWESLNVSETYSGSADDEAFLKELMRRDAEMEAGINVMTREEFMASIRQERACGSASIPAPAEK